jgi:hypothetical protein
MAEVMRFNHLRNVGIGNSAPANKLSVGDGTADTRGVFNPNNAFAIGVANGAGFAGWIGGSGATDTMVFFNSIGTERMRIDSSGNVGIGTSSPSGKLDVNGNLKISSDATYAIDVTRPSAGNTTLRITSGTDAGSDAVLRADIGNTTGTSAVYFGDSGTNGIGRVAYEHNGDYMRFYTNSSERLRITSTGNVGIGTSSPAVPLHINGSNGELLRLSVTSDGGTQQTFGLGFATGNTNTHPAALISAEEVDASDSRASLLFYTRDSNSDIAPTERLRITSTGSVGIGTSSPSGKFHIVGSTYDYLIGFGANEDNYYSCGSSGVHVFRNGATEQARIDASGNFKFNSGYGSAATAYGCRAWVNFDGTGTVAIRASGNVSSITDNGTGDYTVNFTTAMPDANYACVAGYTTPAWGAIQHAYTYTTSNVRIEIATPPTPTYIDASTVTVVIFR